MARAWPFEGEEDVEPVRTPAQFLEQRRGVEAVVVRIGLNDAQMVLVDENGFWQRWVYHSAEEAEEVARSLDVDVHVGEYPEELRVKINAAQRPPKDFDRHAYPEQGGVGPVIPYPENRPRRTEVLKKEVAAAPESSES